MPRKYQHTKELLPQIKKMLDQGMTHKQIEEKTWFNRKATRARTIEERTQKRSNYPSTQNAHKKTSKNITRIQIRK